MKTLSGPKKKLLMRGIALLSIFLLPMALPAQNPRGALRGAVQDASGGRIAAAKVVVQARESTLQREAITDDRGEFRIEDLIPGTYRVTVNANGFGTVSSDANVTISTVRDLTVTMTPASVQQTVKVQGQAASITTEPVNTASAVQQAAISAHDLITIPLPARSFSNIAYMDPGTEPVEPSDPTKARFTSVSRGGSSGLNNEVSVDGVDNSDDWIGGFLQNFSPEAIQEFAIRTAQSDADTGRTTASSVVITPKNGTNQWHGDEAVFVRAADLNARFPIDNPPPNPKQPFSRQNYVGTVGGPIVKDKLWFFSSYEFIPEDASIAYSPASTEQFNALAQLATEGLIPGVSSIPVPANVPVPFRDYISSMRFDYA